MAVVMCNATCAWSSSEEVETNLVLHNVTLSLPKGSLVAIIGEVYSLTEVPYKFIISLFPESLTLEIIFAQYHHLHEGGEIELPQMPVWPNFPNSFNKDL